MKKLKINRETIATLSSSDLAGIHGGGISVISQTIPCPIPALTHGCTGGPCVQTINTPGTSVIQPGHGH